MRKFVSGLLVLALLPPPLWAGKSGFSGGSSGGAFRSSGSSFRPSSFSGGSSFKSVASSAKPSAGFSGGFSPKPAASSAPAPRSSWGFGPTTSSSTPRPSQTPVSVSKKPGAPTFDRLAISESRRAESRANYTRATTPAATFRNEAGKEVKVDAGARATTSVREYVTPERWTSYPQRADVFYQPYISSAVVPVHYVDPFHSYLNFWLLSRSLDEMALFTYHHRAAMDSARVESLYAKNADLRARVKALEDKKVPIDETYAPEGVDRDLLYSQGFVDAAFNPQPKEVTEYRYRTGLSCGWVWIALWVLVKWLFWIALAWGVIWLLFYYRW